MVGTDLQGKGGIAAVIAVLVNEGFLSAHATRYVASHGGHSAWSKARLALSSIWRVLMLCLFDRPQLIHAHVASHASFWRKSLILAIARLFGVATVFHLHGGGFQQFATRESGPLAQRWIRHTLEHSSVVIALSDSWRGFLQEFAPRAKVSVVPNSVKLPPAAPARAPEPGRILFLGRAHRRKGNFDLIDAIAILAPRFPAVRLAMGGDGEIEAVARYAAEKGVGDRLEILGWVGPEQKAEEFARAAVFALPSYDEGLPMAMLEAMAATKAIVVTPVGGIPEAVTDQVNGLLVAPGDVAALAAALAAVLGDAALRDRLGQAAHATICARYSSSAVLAKLDAIYSTLGVPAKGA